MKKLLFLMFLLVAILLPAGHGYAAGEKIKVGFISDERDEQGNYMDSLSAYNIAFLNQIAQYTSWDYEYISVSWAESLAMLEKHQLDFVCSSVHTSERDAVFDYSRNPVGSQQILLYTYAGNSTIYYDDYLGLNNKRIGCIKNSYYGSMLLDYARANNFTYRPHYYGTEKELEDALERREVDAIVVEELAVSAEYKLIGRLGVEPFYFMSYDGNPMMQKMDAAMSRIVAKQPDFENTLRERYYRDITNGQPLYTREEKEYVNLKKEILVGVMPNQYPVSRYHAETDTYDGINEDIIRRIGEISGLNFKFCGLSDEFNPYRILQGSECQLIAGVARTDKFILPANVEASDDYYESMIGLIRKKNQAFDQAASNRVTLLKSALPLQYHVWREYPQNRLVQKDTVEQCIEAVSSGEADVMLMDTTISNYWLQKPKYSGMGLAYTNYLTMPVCMLGLKNADPRMMSIINKTIAVITPKEISNMEMMEAGNYYYKMTLWDTLYVYRYAFIVGGAFVLLALFSLGAFGRSQYEARKVLAAKNEEISRAQKRYDSILEQTRDMIFTWNVQTRRVSHAGIFQKRFGFEPPEDDFPESLGRSEFIHPEDMGAWTSALKEVADGSQLVRCEVRLRDKDYHYTWYQISMTPIRNLKGEIVEVTGLVSDIDHQKKQLNEAKKQAKIDLLTGIYNKGTVQKLIREALEQPDCKGALFIIDMDDFKHINDTYGHKAGDETLEKMGTLLHGMFRATDYVGRLGGDEFMVCLRGVAEEHMILAKAKQLMSQVRGLAFSYDPDFHISVSVGIAQYPDDGSTFESLYEQADKALYRSKQNGKGQFSLRRNLICEK